jgi:hypothetical protein
MYFIDFDSGANLALKVTQTDPVEEDVDFVGSPDASATGFGFFYAGGLSGLLYVSRASWNEWNGEWGFPESAFVKGNARLGLFKWRPFTVKLISNKFPGPDQTAPYDEAELTINGETYNFTGELHHSLLRAILAPQRPSTDPVNGRLATTWGKMKTE